MLLYKEHVQKYNCFINSYNINRHNISLRYSKSNKHVITYRTCIQKNKHDYFLFVLFFFSRYLNNLVIF